MFQKMFSIIGLIFFTAVIITSCQDTTNPLESDTDLSREQLNSAQSLQKGLYQAGYVYTMSNDAGGNEILVFNRSYDGSLSETASYSTGGLGTGAGLGNQGGLRLTRDNRYLLNVNAASNDISIFRVKGSYLKLLGTIPSGGETPISITNFGSLIYVLNAGNGGNISGFRVLGNGKMKHIYKTTLPLSGDATGPAQIEFSPFGRFLVVTEKAVNSILTYKVNLFGRAFGPVVNSSAGETPFGFAFDKHRHIIVSEAFGGAENASTVSSYRINRNGTINVISAAVPTMQSAACWIAVTRSGKFAYTTNAGSGSIGGFSIDRSGTLSLLDDNGRTGVTGDGSTPLDLAFSKGDNYLYSLNGGSHNISSFRVGGDGSLIHIGDFGSLPDGANGLAAQ